MKSNFQLKEVKDLTDEKMTFKDYLILLKEDLKKLPNKPIEFCSAPKYQFKDKKETVLVMGKSEKVKDWHKTLGVTKYLSGTCEQSKEDKKKILITAKKGSEDAIIKQLGDLVKPLGYSVADKASIEDRREGYVELKGLIKQTTYYIDELDEMINYKNRDVRPLIQVKNEDIPATKKIKEALLSKLQAAYNSFSNQRDKLYNNEKGMPQKNVDALEDKFAKNWTAILKLIKTVDKKINGASGVVYNAIQYVNVNKSTIEKYDDENHLKDLATGDLNDRHPKKGSLENKPLHQHLDGGSKGMAFYYRKEENGSITPVVYDFAANRNGNKYQWADGGQLSGPPKIK